MKSNLKINTTIRTISFKKCNHPTEPLLQEHEILNFENQRNMQTASFMWKLRNNETPASISEHFQIRNRTFGEESIMFLLPSLTC